jgi:hypothetical protein
MLLEALPPDVAHRLGPLTLCSQCQLPYFGARFQSLRKIMLASKKVMVQVHALVFSFAICHS